jgi:acetyltransferase-like isoleucine patch superfamily enzyme
MNGNFKDFSRTCSIENLQDHSLTFARDIAHLELLKTTDKKIAVLVNADMEIDKSQYPPNVSIYPTKCVDYIFTVTHNMIYEHFGADKDIYEYGAEVDQSVRVAEGLHIAIGPKGERAQLKHMGNVIFGSGCRVGPLTFIQRASLPGCSTIIKSNALVDGYCTLGHNVVIGENTLVAAGSVVGAGTVVGKNCLLGIHTIVRPHTKICDNVVIGIGSVVIKDLTKPGVYFGSPAEFKKEHSPNWMW